MDLKEFYFKNINESEYQYRFLESVKKENYKYNIFSAIVIAIFIKEIFILYF